MKHHYSEDIEVIELGVDEVGRGPLFGRVYAAAVILPKHNDDFDYSNIKDSKKFSSSKKLKEVYDYIVSNCVDYCVQFESEKTIDDINILQATQKAMHACIQVLIDRQKLNPSKTVLLIDGNYFRPHTVYNNTCEKWDCFPHMCVKGGDAEYKSIAAASIVAKVQRDNYIAELCKEHPDLDEKYSLSTNKGYGAKKHRDGIEQHGISEWHRKTFGICKEYAQKNQLPNITD